MSKFLLRTTLSLALVPGVLHAFTLSFSNGDFTTTPVFSTVNTFAFDIDVAQQLKPAVFSDPVIANIQYSVSGSLDTTPSGFSGFAFNLKDLPSLGDPIPGSQFYALNPSSILGETLRFEVMAGADLSDGLQVSELEELGGSFGAGVVFHLNAREEGTGRYHPAFLQLRSDGTGIIQNSNNMGGDNPQDGFVGDIDVDFGEEYITNLSFDPATFTIGIPEPGVTSILVLAAVAGLAGRRRTG